MRRLLEQVKNTAARNQRREGESGALTGKLIAAPYDAWTSWDADRIAKLMTSPWLTLRRLDHATLRPLLDTIADDAC